MKCEIEGCCLLPTHTLTISDATDKRFGPAHQLNVCFIHALHHCVMFCSIYEKDLISVGISVTAVGLQEMGTGERFQTKLNIQPIERK